MGQPKEVSNPLVLGTAQFGLPYGIANRCGQVGRDEAAAVLDHAWAQGIDTLDTAMAYGDCERRLGEIGIGEWKVISKLPAVPESGEDVAKWVRESVFDSLRRLGVHQLHGLLLHRSQELCGAHAEELRRGMLALKDQGSVEKIGVSIYDPEELDHLGSRVELDLVQAPFNVLDRRLASSGWLARLHHAGTEIHVRSVFLQGLLLMKAGERPAEFDRWQLLWDSWDHWPRDHGLTALHACLGFVFSQPEIDRVVIGVDNLRQLQEILEAVGASCVVPPPELACGDLDLIDPSRWSAS